MSLKNRGYFGVGLVTPKFAKNIGSALRACGCYDASFLSCSGHRYKSVCTDTQKAFRHIPLYNPTDILESCPSDCPIIAVDLVENAIPLNRFVHPERAFYVFGPEDGTLGKEILDKAAYKVYIPTKYCLNLAMAVNTVLYDRTAKLENSNLLYKKRLP